MKAAKKRERLLARVKDFETCVAFQKANDKAPGTFRKPGSKRH